MILTAREKGFLRYLSDQSTGRFLRGRSLWRSRNNRTPAQGFKAICSRCRQPAPGYDQLAQRRFEFIPFWGFLVFLLGSIAKFIWVWLLWNDGQMYGEPTS
jgi:hypothetical protein